MTGKEETDMRLATSTGDFKWYVPAIADMIECIGTTKFKCVNLEQTGVIPEFFAEGDGWKKLADDWGNAAQRAGVRFVVSHAPCLHKPILDDEQTYRANIRAIRRSIEICHMLGIDRIVVHACADASLTVKEFYSYNTKFYRDLLDLAEKYGITVMTENWDNAATHFSTGKDLRDFIDHMDHPLLAACWDTAHGNIDSVAAQIGQYRNIMDIGDKLKGLHISDNFGDCHHHSWPFAGIINFDSVMQGLLDAKYDGYFTFEASYTLLHHNNMPYNRKAWEHDGEMVARLHDPSLELKQKSVDLLYDIGKYILETYDCYEAES